MNLWHRVYERLRAATNSPHVGPADPVRAIDYVEQLCGKVVGLFQEREMLRMLLTAKAFDEGVLTGLLGQLPAGEGVYVDKEVSLAVMKQVEQFSALGQGIIDWGALHEKPKVAAPEKKRLVSLH
jgi:hypothetical protein